MMKLTSLKQKGFTLIEFVVAFAIAAILLTAVVTFSNSVISINRGLNNEANAINQMKNAFNYISRDSQMAGMVNTTSPGVFPLTLSWITYPTNLTRVVYTIGINGTLTRTEYSNQDTNPVSTMVIANNVSLDVTKTNSVWDNINNKLTINMDIVIGKTNVIRQFILTPRVIQSSSQTANTITGSSPSPSNYGNPVTLTASLSPSTITSGTVTFLDGGSFIGVAPVQNGQAIFQVSNLSVGSHSLTAVFSGDALYSSNTSPAWPQLVNKAALTITANNASKTYGQTVTFAGTEFTTAGLVNGNGVTSVTLTSSGAVATAGVSGSPYSIVPSAAVGTGLSNYTISYVNGSLTVTMATPTSIGQANSITSNTFLSVTVPAGGVAAGNTIIVSFAMDPNAGTVSVADTKSNSYSKDVDILNSKGVRTLVFSAPVTTALVAGNTITVTYPATVSKAVSIYSVSGLVSASRVDQTQTGPGTAIAVSSGNTAATAQASELLIGAIGSESYDTTFTVGTGYTVMNSAIANDGNNTNASISIFPEYRIVSATGVYDANGTLSVSRDWAAAIVTYIMQ